jgi:phosphoribosylformylglycinamidine (FGAM) synthase-like enzyme
MKRTKDVETNSLTLLVSQHLTHNQFKNYLTQLQNDVSSRVEMFIVRPSIPGMPIITEVGKEKKTLAELGVTDLTEVVVFDGDV